LGVISKKQGQYEVPICVVLARQDPLAGDDGVFIGFRVAGHIVEELKYCTATVSYGNLFLASLKSEPITPMPFCLPLCLKLGTLELSSQPSGVAATHKDKRS
jgi:hypothetical protein